MPITVLASLTGLLLADACAQAQNATAPLATPIAMIPVDSHAKPGEGTTVSGALEVTGGRAMIAASGAVTAGKRTAHVLLPRRGELRVCASTTVKLAADTSVPAGGAPGLLLAMDRGALELSLANRSAGRNSDVLLTPDFRILIGGDGAGEVKVRLGEKGDTCVDNAGANAPYVVVSSVFEGGAYRVQAGQRVMFQHGSIHSVVDQEKEPCGCPPEARGDNEFPLAQSEGLEPLATPAPTHPGALTGPPLVKIGGEKTAEGQNPIAKKPAESATPAAATPQKSGFFSRVRGFFRRIFGAE